MLVGRSWNESGLGDAVDDVLNGSVGDGEGGNTGFDWNSALNSTGLNTIASGIFNLFGAKTSTGRTSTGSPSKSSSSSSTSPWVWVAGGAAALGIFALVARKK